MSKVTQSVGGLKPLSPDADTLKKRRKREKEEAIRHGDGDFKCLKIALNSQKVVMEDPNHRSFASNLRRSGIGLH